MVIMTTTRFRALPVKDASELRVDRDAGPAGVIYGVSAIQAVEALGHGMQADEITLNQVVEFGNASKSGLKSRFTHPGMSSDGMGKFLGRLRNFRLDEDKAVADLHLAKSSRKTASGDDLGGYVMDLAEEDPGAFGMSIVFDAQSVWRLEDGSEVLAGEERPTNAVGDLPLARVKNLVACDVVDEPAANRDGLFSAALWASNQDAEQAFADIDNVLTEWGVSPDKAYGVAIKYFNARGVNLNAVKGREMAETKTEAKQPEVTAEQVTELSAKLAEVQAQLAAKDAEVQAAQDALAARSESEAELSQRVGKLESALDASNKRNAEMAAEARRKRFGEMAKEWSGNTADHVELLEQLADTSGEEGKAFQFYVQTQNANAEQLNSSELFEELGSSKEAPAPVTFDAAVRAEMAASGTDYDAAAMKVAKAQPELYINRGNN